MSEPKRYEPSSHYSADFGMAQSPAGKWVSYKDYARLKAEVESIRKYWKATGEGVNRYVGKSIALEDEVARLKAEVERLTKAALQVYHELDKFGQVSAKSVHELRDAAKEGKQS